DAGGWGLSARTADIERFGQLYLQGGVWQGRQLVDRGWVEEATSFQVVNAMSGNPNPDWQQGYGYQFWRCRHGAYRGDGAFGQYCVVMPQQDALLAITSGVGDMQVVLNAAWDHLLPAMQPDPLPAGSMQALKRRVAALAVRPPEGQASSPAAARVSGKTYRFEPNDAKIESASVTVDGGRSVATIRGSA